MVDSKKDVLIQLADMIAGSINRAETNTKGDRISTTYLCMHASGDPQNLIPEKCDEIGWFDLEEIKNLPLSRITKLNLTSLS